MVPPLVWLVLLFVGSRLLYLVLVHPDHFFRFGLSGDELYPGTIAKEIMSGLHMPFFDYPATNYSGGSLVVGLIGSCFFRLLSPTVFSLKLTPVLFFTLALVFWYLVLQRHVGERVAVYFALIFVFSPPLFTSYSVAALGSHSESIFFTAFSLFLLFQLLSTESPGRVAPSLLGLTAGFGLWFAYSYGLTLLALLLVWLRHDKPRRLWTRAAYFLPFFAIGFSPWIVMNVQNHFSGFIIDSRPVWAHLGLEHLWKGLTDYWFFLPYQLAANFALDGPTSLQKRITNLSYDLLFVIPMLASWFLTPKTSRSIPQTTMQAGVNLQEFAIVYLCLFALTVQLTDFKIPRYNIPAYPFLFFFLAISIVRLEDGFPRVRWRIRAGFLSSLLLFAVVFHGPLLSFEQAGASLAAKGYSYGFLVEYQLCRDDWRLCDDEKSPRLFSELASKPFLGDLLQDVAPEDKQELSLALAVYAAAAFPFDQGPQGFIQARRLVPPQVQDAFHYLVGRAAMHRYQPNLSKAAEAIAFVRTESAEFHRLALSGIYREWPETLPLTTSPESLTNKPKTVPTEVEPDYWRAVGHYAARYSYDTDSSVAHVDSHLYALLARLDPVVRHHVLQGVGQFWFSQWRTPHLYEIPFAPGEVEHLSPEFHPGLFEGAGMAMAEFAVLSWSPSLNETSSLWRKATAGLSDASISSIRDGWKQFMNRLNARTAPGVASPRCEAEAEEPPAYETVS